MLYTTSTWRRARRKTLTRDGYQCRAIEIYGDLEIRCPATTNLHVHHITRPEDGGARYHLDNLITLCTSHHSRLELRLDPTRDRTRRKPRKPQRPNDAAYRQAS
jgi:5-methylcytosine-specific restriction endonuclease McrA